MRLLYCTCAILLLAPPAADAQQAPASATAYTTFVRGNPIGREDVTVRSDATGVTVTSEGRLGAPANLTIRRAEFRYGPDWAPQLFELNGIANGGEVTIRTTVDREHSDNRSRRKQARPPSRSTAQAMFHANGIVGVLRSARPPARRRCSGQRNPHLCRSRRRRSRVRLVNVQNERMQIGTEFLNARRYDLIFQNPGINTAVTVTTGVDGNLLSVRIPSQGVDIVRVDLASVTSRMSVHSNPGDEAVTIPGDRLQHWRHADATQVCSTGRPFPRRSSSSPVLAPTIATVTSSASR